jgi:TPR repeat protein
MTERGLGAKPDPVAARAIYARLASVNVKVPELNERTDADQVLAQVHAQGDATAVVQAATRLGDIYFGAEDVKRDFVKALAWYRKAAATDPETAGHARVMIAQMIRRGQGIKADPAQGLALLRGLERLPEAQGTLGVLYLDGDGVKRDLAKARELLHGAARNGWRGAHDQLVRLAGPSGHWHLVAGPRYWAGLATRAGRGDRKAAEDLGKGLCQASGKIDPLASLKLTPSLALCG